MKAGLVVFTLLVSTSLLGCGGDEASTGSSGSASSSGEAPCLAAAEPFGADPNKGESFPDLEIVACDGSRITMDALRCEAKVTLISIGAGWCEPCIAETPDLEAAHQELSNEGVRVIQILFQDAQTNAATTLFCEKWVEDRQLTLPVFIDPLENTLSLFDVTSTPLNVAIDHEGRVLWSQVGTVPADLIATLRGLAEAQ